MPHVLLRTAGLGDEKHVAAAALKDLIQGNRRFLQVRSATAGARVRVCSAFRRFARWRQRSDIKEAAAGPAPA